jgi:hypothetical protein
MAGLREGEGEIDGGGSFAYAAFLIRNCDYPTHINPAFHRFT